MSPVQSDARRRTLQVLVVATALVVALSLSGQAWAAIVHFNSFLDGLQETPPNATPATGFADFFYDTTSDTITSGTLTYSGLIGTVSAAHIHGPAAVGVPAGVIVGLPSLFSPIDLSGILIPAAHEASLLSDLTYFNVHSNIFPGGEIRGQIVVVPEPSTLTLFATVFAMVGVALGVTALRRRRR